MSLYLFRSFHFFLPNVSLFSMQRSYPPVHCLLDLFLGICGRLKMSTNSSHLLRSASPFPFHCATSELGPRDGGASGLLLLKLPPHEEAETSFLEDESPCGSSIDSQHQSPDMWASVILHHSVSGDCQMPAATWITSGESHRSSTQLRPGQTTDPQNCEQIKWLF